ncbi:helix-turn-helix domain-containing protein [Sphingopyxis sp. C-1]|uniref:AlbA family DNA-binding domain-containing protein n=1 Tax=Sphingopyxis sp. C-1 TaxID=262667 RepID=UPI0006C165EA|nr:ATP-binding protein [Sphingopyxis sp. C-1]GAO77478.1 unique hypothetical [Sphingopyxis sp. C-1]
MAKRTITDVEIALIKAMLSRDMKNNDIQFFFNRPDRPVNSGRITGIRNGTYGPSKSISAASNKDLDAFIAAYAGGAATAGATTVALDLSTGDPLADDMIASLFTEGNDGLWRLGLGETDLHECKTSFGLKHPGAWLRAVAALANNSGGYIFFGIPDKGTVDENGVDVGDVALGMKTDEFAKMDPADVTRKVKSVFDPTPRVRTRLVEIGGASIGVVYVAQHESRPVIATKNEGYDVREGDIYYRYPGQSARIKYSDLRTLLDARDRDAREQILPMVERLLQLGPERTLIADLVDGTLTDGKHAIRIDEKLVEKLTFVKEGEFSEVAGAPTLRLIGDVQASTDKDTGSTKFGLVTRDALIDAFLDQSDPDEPEAYIRFAVEVGQDGWYPLHYFAKLAGMSRAELEAFINSLNITSKRKENYIKRIQPGAAFDAPVGTPKAFLDRLLAGEKLAVIDAKEAGAVAQALEGLPDDFEAEPKEILWLLKQCNHFLKGKPAQSYARRANCRVDELLFSSG